MTKILSDETSIESPPGPYAAERTNAPSGKPRRQAPYPHLFRLLHWVLPLCMVVSVLTGLSLHAAARPGWSLVSGVLPRLFWPGEVHVIHLSAATVFLPSLVAVVWVYSRRLGGTGILPVLWPKHWRDAGGTRRRATHLVLLGGGLTMIASGLLLESPVGPAWIYWTARLVHSLSGLVVLPIALAWHLIHGLGRFRRLLLPAFHPWSSPEWSQLVWFVPLGLMAACLTMNVALPYLADRELTAPRIPAFEGGLQSLPWSEAPPLKIELADGVGFDRGRTSVTLRALHDGEELFVMAEWLDPTEDRRYMPWEKTAGGWRHLVTDPDDESVYYEDKFSLVFPMEPDGRFARFGCATYCHLGGGQPYGYKEADRIVDVWHWKAVRTDPVGQVDDKYWLSDDPEAPHLSRHGDPSESGGYTKESSEEAPRPAVLPDDLSVVQMGCIPKEHAVEYSPEAAGKIPTGSIVPAIVVSAFVGDRGDVGCESHYGDGRWRLWIRRKLDTRSPYDLRFVPGASHLFGCAAFDHTSNRHAYGLSVYRLVLEE